MRVSFEGVKKTRSFGWWGLLRSDFSEGSVSEIKDNQRAGNQR